MKIQDFFDKYNGKGIDYDGYYGFQCVDLYRQYCKECLELPQSPPTAGAVNIWNSYLTKYFDRISNQPNNAPIMGDIIIWGTGVGQFGHIAICSSATVMNFVSFDQNWPVGSLCHLQNHNYKYVLGWLRVKAPIASAIVTPVTAPTVSTTPVNYGDVVTLTPEPSIPVEVVPQPLPSQPEPTIIPETPIPTSPVTIPIKSNFFAKLLGWILSLFRKS